MCEIKISNKEFLDLYTKKKKNGYLNIAEVQKVCKCCYRTARKTMDDIRTEVNSLGIKFPPNQITFQSLIDYIGTSITEIVKCYEIEKKIGKEI